MKIIYIDVETTGTDCVKDRICQLSILLEIDGEYMGEMNLHIENDLSLFSPKAKQYYEANKPFLPPAISEDEAYNMLLQLLDKVVDKRNTSDKLFVVGYSVNFDIDFIHNLFLRKANPYLFSYIWGELLDVRVMYAQLLGNKRSSINKFTLSNVCELAGVKIERAHDSLSDIKATRELFKKISIKYEEDVK